MCGYQPRTTNRSRYDIPHIRPVQIRMLDFFRQYVAPVQSVRSKIQSQTSGPSLTVAAQLDQIRTVRICAAYTHFGKEYVPKICLP